MELVLEGTEEAIKLADKVVKLASELSMAVYELAGCCGGSYGAKVKIIPTEETGPAAVTTEPEKND